MGHAATPNAQISSHLSKRTLNYLTTDRRSQVPERINVIHKLLRAGILITFGMLIICIINGCGDDDPPVEVTAAPQSRDDVPPVEVTAAPQSRDDVPPPPVVTVVVDPAPGSIVPSNAGFTLTFSKKVVAVTVHTCFGFRVQMEGDAYSRSRSRKRSKCPMGKPRWLHRDHSSRSLCS